jgi:hypothetical protein
MSGIKTAFESLGQGISNAFKGIGEFLGGVLTLDFNTAGKGLSDIGHGVLDTGRGLVDLLPPALAANTLMDGAFDKALGGGSDSDSDDSDSSQS